MDTKVIASTIVSEMSPQERAAFTVEGWRESLGWTCLDAWDGVDIDELAAEIEEAVIQAEAAKWIGI